MWEKSQFDQIGTVFPIIVIKIFAIVISLVVISAAAGSDPPACFLFQAQVLRDPGRVGLPQLFQERVLFQLCGIPGIAHECMFHDHRRYPEQLAVMEDAVAIALFAVFVAALLNVSHFLHLSL